MVNPVVLPKKNKLINRTMNKSELKQLIKEEIMGQNFLYLESSIISLYSEAGIKTQYDDSSIQKYGSKVVSKAIELAPKILSHREKIANFTNILLKDPKTTLLLNVLKNNRLLGGDSTQPSIGDLINTVLRNKLN